MSADTLQRLLESDPRDPFTREPLIGPLREPDVHVKSALDDWFLQRTGFPREQLIRIEDAAREANRQATMEAEAKRVIEQAEFERKQRDIAIAQFEAAEVAREERQAFFGPSDGAPFDIVHRLGIEDVEDQEVVENGTTTIGQAAAEWKAAHPEFGEPKLIRTFRGRIDGYGPIFGPVELPWDPTRTLASIDTSEGHDTIEIYWTATAPDTTALVRVETINGREPGIRLVPVALDVTIWRLVKDQREYDGLSTANAASVNLQVVGGAPVKKARGGDTLRSLGVQNGSIIFIRWRPDLFGHFHSRWRGVD